MSRVLVIGLDGLDPVLVDRWLPDLPNLRHLAASGMSGPLQSIVQPVTPPAWTAMISGRNQGHFGFTDFLYRPGPGYGPEQLVDSGAVRVPTVFSLAAAAGLRTVNLGVPVNYPPVTVPGGVSIACFMAPSLDRCITSPPDLQKELLSATSQPYLIDVVAQDATRPDRDELSARLLELDRQRFDLAAHLMRTRSWDLLFLVCMGPDRASHLFMRYQDPDHRRHPDDDRYSDVIYRQYRYCDCRIGELVEAAGPETTVMVVSDHGSQRLDGRVYLNRWLVEHEYLHLSQPSSSGPLPLHVAQVDWSKTTAWASGYGGQIYVNVQDREPLGVVPESRVQAVCREIADGLRLLPHPDGGALRVKHFLGRDLFDGPYAERCPDLCVQFEDLRYLASNRVDPGPLVEPLGPDGIDDGSHTGSGYVALAGPGVPAAGRLNGLHLLDVAPTMLDLLDVAVPDLDGQVVHRELTQDSPFQEDELVTLTNRLQKLYLD
jgi:predicted AlkP superfamily phosphohydrolase/phosphomutase